MQQLTVSAIKNLGIKDNFLSLESRTDHFKVALIALFWLMKKTKITSNKICHALFKLNLEIKLILVEGNIDNDILSSQKCDSCRTIV